MSKPGKKSETKREIWREENSQELRCREIQSRKEGGEPGSTEPRDKQLQRTNKDLCSQDRGML